MIKLIVGAKGSGKTKTMIDMINEATKTTSGNIVVIEMSMKATTEINHAARLLDVDEYHIQGAEMLYGFIAGVLAGNYDITELASLRLWITIWTPQPSCWPISTRLPATPLRWL